MSRKAASIGIAFASRWGTPGLRVLTGRMLEVVRFIGADRKVRKIAEGLAFSHRYPVEAPGGARAADRLRAMPMCPAPWPVVRDGADGLKDGADGMLFSAGG